MIREKKPPISINEMASGGAKPPAEKGALSYAGGNGGDKHQATVQAKPKLNLIQLLISVGLTVLVVILLGNFLFTSKQDSVTLLENQRILEGQIDGVSSSVAAVQSRVGTESGRIDNVIANQGNYVSASALQGLSDSVTGFGSRITSLEEDIAGLEEGVEILGTTNTTNGNGNYASQEDLDNLDGRVTTLEDWKKEWEDNPPGGFLDYYLTGDKKLYVTSSRSGFFTARITAIYNTPQGWEDHMIGPGSERNYVEHVGWWEDSYGWVIGVSFYTKSFGLNAGEESSYNVPFTGLPTGYTTYVEILPGMISELTEDDTI